jgi:hypothetical protein
MVPFPPGTVGLINVHLALQLHATARKAQRLLEAHSAPYLARCAEVLESSREAAQAAGSKHALVLPKTWPADPNFPFYKAGSQAQGNAAPAAAAAAADPAAGGDPGQQQGEAVAEEAALAEERVGAKFLPLSSGFLRVLLAARDLQALELPFELTPLQRDIMRHGLTKFVLGRWVGQQQGAGARGSSRGSLTYAIK